MAIPTEQAATAALLRTLAGAEPIETHISLVFVGTDTVFKLRKAVCLSFLDFTKLAERHRTALREFDLNRAAAPGLYRDVVPVVRHPDGTVTLGGEGDPIDWVVRMAVVPADDFLERRLPDGLSPAILDGLGDSVAAWHAALSPSPKDQADALRHVIDGNAEAAHAAGILPSAVATWEEGARAALDARADWLRARGAGGFVRRAHGDLHLGNICLWQGRPVPFDALEFDEDLATIDLGYDLAFLLMDLDVRASRPAANRVLNRYIARTGDWDLVRGLPLFLSLRAMVRAHVEASRARAATSRRYLEAALAYLHPPPPQAVAVGGLQGTGKTTLARALAPGLGPAPGALVLRSDEIRKRRHGVPPEQRLPASAYTEAVSRAVLAELCRALRETLAAGHAAIADATFLDPADRQDVAVAAGRAHFLGVWLQAPLAELEARLACRTGDASDADVAVLRRAAAADKGSGDWLAVDASDAALALASVRAALTMPTIRVPPRSPSSGSSTMAIRKILLPLTGTAAGEAALATALIVARLWDAHVTALHVRVDSRDVAPLAGEGLSGAMIEEMMSATERESSQRAQAVRAMFDRFVQEHSVTVGDARPCHGGATASFAAVTGREEDLVAQQARLADLTIVPHPEAGEDVSSSDALHAVLFDSGRPVLIAPRLPPTAIGRRIALAWNGSAESAAAALSAIPWMQRAEAVRVFSAEEYQRRGPFAPELVDYLALHKVQVDLATFRPHERDVGAGLLRAVHEFGADLLCMGAYSHSRLRQLILGGVTRHVLEHADLPVMMNR